MLASHALCNTSPASQQTHSDDRTSNRERSSHKNRRSRGVCRGHASFSDCKSLMSCSMDSALHKSTLATLFSTICRTTGPSAHGITEGVSRGAH